ncbi:transposase [Nitrospira tepida]|uniref:Mutator family transposase n=1 Tax=Nitrospira tepida TaxID=2973512 RepID=A0AA86T2E2_9BACT|nr:IS256 family transposase [Nitrospira tepida]CAI4030694.1 transposase [Nitrospira tepida]
MKEQSTGTDVESRSLWDHLEEFVRGHIQQFVQRLLVEDVTMRLGRAKSARRTHVDAPDGYRNGYGKPRKVTLTCGTITLQRPRVRRLAERFVSRILPLFKRHTKQVGELLPQLYLHGLALGDFELALRGLMGESAPLSPASLQRLKAQWKVEYEAWTRRRLDDLEVVYVWADGLYVKAGLEASKAALLILIGALTDGRKVVLAVESGQRESKESWGAVLRDLRMRGLKPWRCTIADGHLGIWAALAEQQPTAAEQRCWNHRLVNVLDAIPKPHQAEASTWLKTLPYAETQAACERLRDQFSRRYRALAPKAVERLHHDWERLITFYQFPKEHWRHLRTTNVVESPFAAVRLRTAAGKRFKRIESATALIWKVLQVAEQTFRRLNAPELLPTVYAGTRYVDGVKQATVAHEDVAA